MKKIAFTILTLAGLSSAVNAMGHFHRSPHHHGHSRHHHSHLTSPQEQKPALRK